MDFELRYRPLTGRFGPLSFPCSPGGEVELDALGERQRNDYLFARAVVGLDFARPVVCECPPFGGERSTVR